VARAADEDVTTIDDGRVHRSRKSKAAIAAAFVALIDEGVLSPTSHEVAERAGVGHRTVFRRFQDMESLYALILDEIRRLSEPLLSESAPEKPLVVRIRHVIRQRARFHRRVTNFRRALFARYWTSPTLHALVSQNQRQFRALIVRDLPEARTLPTDRFEALDLLLSFEAWSRLLELQHLSERTARRVLEHAVVDLFERAD
jgi:AcrR family transcriptional regulator